MAERPILFSKPMVLALLDDSKTQTRRIVKLRPHQQVEERDDGTPWPWMHDGDRDADHWLPCPYGEVGDRLWVKETWRTASSLDAKSPSAIADACIDAGYRTPWAPLAYEADGARNGSWRGFEPAGDAEPGKTRVSIHMPRWASRITLEVTGVRVERLQDISEADARAEGVESLPMETKRATAKLDYMALWDQINGPGSWDANPWVWVVEFTRIKP